MVNHNAPDYSYKGYFYNPDEDEYLNGDGSVDNIKIQHHISMKIEPWRIHYTASTSPYRYMTEPEFREFIDIMDRVTAR